MEENVRRGVCRQQEPTCRDNGRFVATQTDLERLWSRSQFSPSGCALWLGATNAGGWGVVRVRVQPGVYRTELVHRWAWRLLRGEIPPRYTLDHLIGPDEPCSSKLCWWPFGHLEAVPNAVNARRRHERERLLNGVAA